ncbi:nucleotide disphospho-sugar-binding domain-containing protein [Paraflavitalea sp. CAU 1676]|uniref:glycosyltransferase n=1 Tax=Paraflavitalea sp. CAU 1676 TaxID=3032598 RepID=UPI0023DBC739|nr:nucleotide disphospho-sugar-binding domain-containing protein [Paraflavitalea sp. CAU 1676]MDF2189932.1 glycosyltransferase [Paraflavitalea sp. CAU 1676]
MEKNKYYGFPANGNGKKILFANVPADGHFNPLTGLAMHLKSIGYDVRWYTSETYSDKLRKLGIPHYPFNRAFDFSGGEPDDVFPERAKHKSQVSKLNFDLINVFILRSTEYFEDIQEIYQEFPFDLVIADVTFGALPFVREKMHIPAIAIGVVPLTETSRDLGPAGLGLTPASGFFGRRKQDVMRFIADNFIFRKSNQVFRKIFREYDIDPGGSNVFDALTRKASLLLQSGTPGFEYKRSDLGSNVRFLGPLLPYQSTQQRERWYHPKLEQYDKVILVTQGTVEKDPEKIIVPTIEAFRNSNHLVIVTTGGSKTGELRKRYQSDNLIIEDFIPFDDVMPYSDVYVTNGGYGGVMLGVQHLLPLVVGGVHEGKLEINARVGYFKLGIDLKTEKPTPAQVKQSVEEVLKNDTYRQHVKTMAAEFNRYDPHLLCAGYVAELLQGKTPVRTSHSINNDKVLVRN